MKEYVMERLRALPNQEPGCPYQDEYGCATVLAWPTTGEIVKGSLYLSKRDIALQKTTHNIDALLEAKAHMLWLSLEMYLAERGWELV